MKPLGVQQYGNPEHDKQDQKPRPAPIQAAVLFQPAAISGVVEQALANRNWKTEVVVKRSKCLPQGYEELRGFDSG